MARKTTPQNAKSPVAAGQIANETPNAAKCTKALGRLSKSTATAAQYARLLELLRLAPRNTIELRSHGIMAPAARVKELNDRYGFAITTADRLTLWDAEGFPHVGVALYRLDAEPEVT